MTFPILTRAGLEAQKAIFLREVGAKGIDRALRDALEDFARDNPDLTLWISGTAKSFEDDARTNPVEGDEQNGLRTVEVDHAMYLLTATAIQICRAVRAQLEADGLGG